ncbi:MAG: DUF2156 domain-containing protein, partial [Candidatus Helarchaeota archaeon]
LIHLPGRKLYRKRRWLKRFQEKYPTYEFHRVSTDFLEFCKNVQLKWCNMNECRMSMNLEAERQAINNAFEFYSKLKFRGGLILVDGQCVAYTFGEKLNQNTVVIHIEKALKEYPGAYQAINHHFAKDCCEDVLYINREQDLGNMGLRKAKQSYYPHHMVQKSIITYS